MVQDVIAFVVQYWQLFAVGTAVYLAAGLISGIFLDAYSFCLISKVPRWQVPIQIILIAVLAQLVLIARTAWDLFWELFHWLADPMGSRRVDC